MNSLSHLYHRSVLQRSTPSHVYQMPLYHALPIGKLSPSRDVQTLTNRVFGPTRLGSLTYLGTHMPPYFHTRVYSSKKSQNRDIC
jgi:hypothetical protein